MTTAPTPLEHEPHTRHDYRITFVGILALVLIGIAIAIVYAVLSDSSSSTSTVQGSGVLAQESRTVPASGSVELAGSNNVTIRVGERQSVQVYGDDNLIDRVTTRVNASTLVIGSSPGSYATRTPMRVEVSVPSLSALTLSGSGNITITGIEQPHLTVTISGSGVVIASGTTDQLDVTISGSGDAQLGQIEASAVRAVVSGSGQIIVTATESLDASVPGSGSIVYGGNPSDVTKSVTGSGAITP